MGKEVVFPIINSFDGCLGHFESSSQRNPKIIPTFEEVRVIDFDCGDYFSVVVTDNSMTELNPEKYREVKYARTQQMVRKIVINDDKRSRQNQLIRTPSELLVDYNFDEGKVLTHQIKSYMLKENMRFDFKKAIIPKSDRAPITLQNMEEKVSEFFGIIDFTKLPLHLLSLEEKERRKNLKRDIRIMVDELCTHSSDFKDFLKRFDGIAKLIDFNADISFDRMFFSLIMKNPLIKKIVVSPQNLERKPSALSNRKPIIPSMNNSARKRIIPFSARSTNRSSAPSHMLSSSAAHLTTKDNDLYDPIVSILSSGYDSNLLKMGKKIRPISTITKDVKRIDLDLLKKQEIEQKTMNAKRSVKFIKCQKEKGIVIKSQQRKITSNVYRKQREINLRTKKTELKNNIRLREDQLRNRLYTDTQAEEQRIQLYRNWQRRWLQFLSISLFWQKFSILALNAKKIKYESIVYLLSVLTIQKHWRIKCCVIRIRNLSTKQKICLVILSHSIKRKYKKRMKRLMSRDIVIKLAANVTRKKARIGVSKFKNKVLALTKFYQYVQYIDKERCKQIEVQWDNTFLAEYGAKTKRSNEENPIPKWKLFLEIYVKYINDPMMHVSMNETQYKVETQRDYRLEDYHAFMIKKINISMTETFLKNLSSEATHQVQMKLEEAQSNHLKRRKTQYMIHDRQMKVFKKFKLSKQELLYQIRLAHDFSLLPYTEHSMIVIYYY